MAKKKKIRMVKLQGYRAEDEARLGLDDAPNSLPDVFTVVGKVAVVPFNLDCARLADGTVNTELARGIHLGIGKTENGDWYMCLGEAKLPEANRIRRYYAFLISEAMAESYILHRAPQEYARYFGEQQSLPSQVGRAMKPDTPVVSNVDPEELANNPIRYGASPSDRMVRMLEQGGWSRLPNRGGRLSFIDDTVCMDLCPHVDYIGLARIIVAPEFHGQGIARAALAKLTAIADEANCCLKLEAYPFSRSGLRQVQLIKWYERNGFFLYGREWCKHAGRPMCRMPRVQQDLAIAI